MAKQNFIRSMFVMIICLTACEKDDTRIGKGVTIDGLIWATCNVDAPGTFAASPQAAGRFYQWNRKAEWPSSGDVSEWNYSMPSGASWTAVNDPCPAGWRVPTIAELGSLTNSGYEWTDDYNGTGVSGGIFGVAPNTLFLPASGYRDDSGTLCDAGIVGRYWSLTRVQLTVVFGMDISFIYGRLYLNSNGAGVGAYGQRFLQPLLLCQRHVCAVCCRIV